MILAFLCGVRHTYKVFDWLWAVILFVLVFRVAVLRAHVTIKGVDIKDLS